MSVRFLYMSRAAARWAHPCAIWYGSLRSGMIAGRLDSPCSYQMMPIRGPSCDATCRRAPQHASASSIAGLMRPCGKARWNWSCNLGSCMQWRSTRGLQAGGGRLPSRTASYCCFFCGASADDGSSRNACTRKHMMTTWTAHMPAMPAIPRGVERTTTTTSFGLGGGVQFAPQAVVRHRIGWLLGRHASRRAPRTISAVVAMLATGMRKRPCARTGGRAHSHSQAAHTYLHTASCRLDC